MALIAASEAETTARMNDIGGYVYGGVGGGGVGGGVSMTKEV